MWTTPVASAKEISTNPGMEDSQPLFELVRSLMHQLPTMVTLLGCMVFATIRWKRHPKVSLLLIITLVLLFIHGLFFTAVYTWVPGWILQTRSFDASGSIQTVLTVLGLISNTTLAVIFVLMLVSIFMQRKTRVTSQV